MTTNIGEIRGHIRGSDMKIGGFQKVTLIDYPGKISCTVFCVGCNFRCPFCYNSELVLPEKIEKQPKISEREFFKFLKERKGLLEGVCFSGGEPTINKKLPDFIKKIKKMGFSVKLDTNGSNPEMLKELINNNLVDYVAMDIKAPLGLKYQIPNPKFQTNSKFQTQHQSEARCWTSPAPKQSFWCGVPNSKILRYKKAIGIDFDLNKIKESIDIIKNSGVDYEFRTTVVPTIHTKEDIIQIAREISPAKRYFLQNFRPEKTIDPKFEKINPHPNAFLLEIQQVIAPFFDVCQIR